MKHKILIVDDAELNREILRTILEEQYDSIEAEGGAEAIRQLKEHAAEIAVVLLDLIMPEVDGYQVLTYMNEENLIKEIPVIMISQELSKEAERRCFELGVTDFVHRPFDQIVIRKRVNNVVELFQYKYHLEEQVALQAKALKETNEKMIDALATIVEYRNLESGEHIRRVKAFTRILAEQMATDFPEYALTPEMIDVIVDASALHDVGKICIKDDVLLKPGKLTEDEFNYMKSHTIRGCEMVETIDLNWDEQYRQTVYDICRFHHERYDGRGYPDGRKGDEIPISAQLVSIADVYDALVSPRVYKNAYDKDKSYYMILQGECGVFSPKLLVCFQNSRKKFEALLKQQ